MSLSEWADWAAIASTLFAAGATCFAGIEIYKSRRERKQDLRFMYAQRAVMLNDLINQEFSIINEIDQKLAFDKVSEPHLTMIEKLSLGSLLNEAKICASIANACDSKSPAGELVRYFEMLGWMDRQLKQIPLQGIVLSAPTPTSMLWLEGHTKRKAIKKEICKKDVFQSLVGELTESIHRAYQVKA